MQQTEWTMNIPGWTSTPLNKLMTVHWGTAARCKKADVQVVGNAKMAAGVPDATTKRRIEIIVIYPKGQRQYDKDAFLKSLLDAMVRAKVLVNDSPAWADYDLPEYARGDKLRTIITVQELP